MSHKRHMAAFSTFAPGPDLDGSPAAGVQTVMPGSLVPTYLSTRITAGAPVGSATQQFTPDQSFFRGSLASGRWQSDSDVHASVTKMTQDPATGAVDAVRMEPVHRDGAADYYADLGGKGGVDYAARRP